MIGTPQNEKRLEKEINQEERIRKILFKFRHNKVYRYNEVIKKIKEILK